MVLRHFVCVSLFAFVTTFVIGCGDSSSKSTENTRPEIKTGKNKEKGMPAPPPIEPAVK